MEDTLLAAYQAVEKEKIKMKLTRCNLYDNDELTDVQKEEILTEIKYVTRGLNLALKAIKNLDNKR